MSGIGFSRECTLTNANQERRRACPERSRMGAKQVNSAQAESVGFEAWDSKGNRKNSNSKAFLAANARERTRITSPGEP